MPLYTVRAEVTALLNSTREQQTVVGPLVEHLLSLGWQLSQMRFGRHEWRVPKNPSEATRREHNQSFQGFPVDIAIFDDPTRAGDPTALIFIIEAKVEEQTAGVRQLETYISLEPHVKGGAWTNTADPSAPGTFVFREPSGSLIRRVRPLTELPRPGEPITAEQRRLTFQDLTQPSPETVKQTFQDVLDKVVTNDPNVTRREEQLDQLCNLILAKLHSDKRGRPNPTQPPAFRLFESPARTAAEVKTLFAHLVATYPDTFVTAQDREIRLSDQSINDTVERLAPYRLLDMGIEALSLGFQVLRAAALRSGEGQYFTPLPVIRAGVKLMKVELEDFVIDPACGTGGFLVEALNQMQTRHPGMELDISRWAQTSLHGIDKDAIGVKLTKAMMQIAGDGSAHCVRGDSVRTYSWSRDYPHLNSGTFRNGRFTVVITNPPFGQNLKVSAADARLSQLDIARLDNGEYRELEIGLVFLQRAYDLLQVGGRLGIILPETYFFSPNYSWLFDWMRPRFQPLVVVNVPMEAFAGFCRAKTNFYVFQKIAYNA